jgi:hypothetical protein
MTRENIHSSKLVRVQTIFGLSMMQLLSEIKVTTPSPDAALSIWVLGDGKDVEKRSDRFNVENKATTGKGASG